VRSGGSATSAVVERGAARLRLQGEFDLTVRADLRCGLDAAIGTGAETLHIDTSGVSFMDSACAWELRRARSVLDATGRAVVMESPAPAVVLVFSALGWRDVLSAMALPTAC